MKRKIFTILICAILITTSVCACSDNKENSGKTLVKETEKEAEAEELQNQESNILDGRWLCADIKGFVTEDTPADVKDDFGLFVNKDWILSTDIRDGMSTTTTLSECSFDVIEREMGLVKDDSLTGSDAELVRKLYEMASDWDFRNEEGPALAKPYMDAIMNIKDLNGLYDYMCSKDNLMHLLPVQVNVDSDFYDSSLWVTYVDPHALMLATPDEYKERTEVGEIYYNETKAVASYMLGRLGYSEDEADKMYENAIAYETLIANAMPSREENSKLEILYYTPKKLIKLAGSFPMKRILKASGLSGGKKIIIDSPDFYKGLSDIYSEENVPLIRDWLAVRTASELRDLLDEETISGVNKIYDEMYGISGKKDENLQMYGFLNGYLPVPMDNLYINAYCNERQKKDILEIVDEVKGYYREMLENDVDWLGEETRKNAIEKLDNMIVHAVYPDEMADWSDLKFKGKDEGGNLLTAHRDIEDYKLSIKAKKIDGKVDRNGWDQIEIPATEVNATYKAANNSINIQAGVLNGDVYNEDMSYEQKMGGIGSIIGHEISHAFDSNGAKNDKNGEYNTWWTDEDFAAFEERVNKLVEWYDGFIPANGIKVSGDMVKEEATADMASIKCMLYIASQKKDFDYDAFFTQYAKLWRDQSTYEQFKENVLTDIHPPHYLRVNATLAQYDKFQEVYGIKEGDGMYIAPEDRVAVW